MNNDACVITVNGDDYYYPCDKRDDIIQVGNRLVNVGSSSITLYREFVVYGDSSTGYPRIVMPTNTYAYYRSTSSSSSYQTLNVNSVEFKSTNFTFSIYLLIVIVGVLVLQLFKRG